MQRQRWRPRPKSLLLQDTRVLGCGDRTWLSKGNAKWDSQHDFMSFNKLSFKCCPLVMTFPFAFLSSASFTRRSACNSSTCRQVVAYSAPLQPRKTIPSRPPSYSTQCKPCHNPGQTSRLRNVPRSSLESSPASRSSSSAVLGGLLVLFFGCLASLSVHFRTSPVLLLPSEIR